MYKRIQFGVTVLDDNLDEKTKLAIECFQDAINKKRSSEKT